MRISNPLLFYVALGSVVPCQAAGARIGTLRGGESERELSTPVPPGDSITFVSANDDDTVSVRLRQTFVGGFGTCGSGNTIDQALQVFSVYKDPSTGLPTCVLKRNVDACWDEVKKIACDATTNTATIDLYIRDELFSANFHQVKNPKVGNCLGTGDVLGRTIMVTATFDCLDGGEGPGSICSSTADCSEGLWCAPPSFFMDPPFCKPYAALGQICGGMVAPGMEETCDPVTAFCSTTMSCMGAFDFGGECMAHGGECNSSSDCAENQYCDGVCKPRRALNECCDPVQAPCEVGLICTDVDVFGQVASVCL